MLVLPAPRSGKIMYMCPRSGEDNVYVSEMCPKWMHFVICNACWSLIDPNAGVNGRIMMTHRLFGGGTGHGADKRRHIEATGSATVTSNLSEQDRAIASNVGLLVYFGSIRGRLGAT